MGGTLDTPFFPFEIDNGNVPSVNMVQIMLNNSYTLDSFPSRSSMLILCRSPYSSQTTGLLPKVSPKVASVGDPF